MLEVLKCFTKKKGVTEAKMASAPPKRAREMGFLEGLAYLFKPETLSNQWYDAARTLLSSFGIVTALVVGAAVPVIASYAAEQGWIAKEHAEAVKTYAPIGAALAEAAPTP